jgi:hypothetical protein
MNADSISSNEWVALPSTSESAVFVFIFPVLLFLLLGTVYTGEFRNRPTRIPTSEQIQENAEAFLKEILRLRPASAKGTYMRSITLSTTMGPPIQIDRNAAVAALR